MASEVSGKRKNCGDQHPAECQPLATHRIQGSPGAIAGQPGSWQTEISTLPQLDAAILQQVRALGHYPQGIREPKTQDEQDERKLYLRIKKKQNETLHSDTWQRSMPGRTHRLSGGARI